MIKESLQFAPISSLNYIQFHYSCNTMKKNPRPLRILEVGFKSKKLDISIIICMNENIEIPDKSTINEKSICHHPTRLDDYIGIAYTCFQKKNCVNMYSYNGQMPQQICHHTIMDSILELSFAGKIPLCHCASYNHDVHYLKEILGFLAKYSSSELLFCHMQKDLHLIHLRWEYVCKNII